MKNKILFLSFNILFTFTTHSSKRLLYSHYIQSHFSVIRNKQAFLCKLNFHKKWHNVEIWYVNKTHGKTWQKSFKTYVFKDFQNEFLSYANRTNIVLFRKFDYTLVYAVICWTYSYLTFNSKTSNNLK